MDKLETNGAANAADESVLLKFQGVTIRSQLLHLAPGQAVLGFPAWTAIPQTGSAAEGLEIVQEGRSVYAGPARFRSVIHCGTEVFCEMALEKEITQPAPSEAADGGAGKRLDRLFSGLDGIHKISSEFKLVIADMESFLRELHSWCLNQELRLQSEAHSFSSRGEGDLLIEVSPRVNRVLDEIWLRFEEVALGVPSTARALHRRYVRDRLHPWVLCAPFAFRAFNKPLGYPGDFEIVRMISGDPWRGATLYAKLLNGWFLRQTPAEAHRNRIEYLSETLANESLRVMREGRGIRVFNLGCGPAIEVQSFLRGSVAAKNSSFKLVDFSQEALAYLGESLARIASETSHKATVILEKHSVQQLLKESLRAGKSPARVQYDLVYCAGLFDYFPDETCHRVMELLFGMVAPGGLFLATNVYDNGTFLQSMDCLLDWQLICRSAQELAAIGPSGVDASQMRSDMTGANVILEVRKPEHA